MTICKYITVNVHVKLLCEEKTPAPPPSPLSLYCMIVVDLLSSGNRKKKNTLSWVITTAIHIRNVHYLHYNVGRTLCLSHSIYYIRCITVKIISSWKKNTTQKMYTISHYHTKYYRSLLWSSSSNMDSLWVSSNLTFDCEQFFALCLPNNPSTPTIH